MTMHIWNTVLNVNNQFTFFKNITLILNGSVHSRKLQKGASGPLDSKTGGRFQKLGVDKGPRVSKLEGHF
jgi:hypothetical protein